MLPLQADKDGKIGDDGREGARKMAFAHSISQRLQGLSEIMSPSLSLFCFLIIRGCRVGWGGGTWAIIFWASALSLCPPGPGFLVPHQALLGLDHV